MCVGAVVRQRMVTLITRLKKVWSVANFKHFSRGGGVLKNNMGLGALL